MLVKIWESLDSWKNEEPSVLEDVKHYYTIESGSFVFQLKDSVLIVPATFIVEIFEN